jgi:hypothetical protein
MRAAPGHTRRRETAMPPRTRGYDAYIVGEHDLPDEASDLDVRDGDVVVHDMDTDEWSVMSRAAFDRDFEWS